MGFPSTVKALNDEALFKWNDYLHTSIFSRWFHVLEVRSVYTVLKGSANHCLIWWREAPPQLCPFHLNIFLSPRFIWIGRDMWPLPSNNPARFGALFWPGAIFVWWLRCLQSHRKFLSFFFVLRRWRFCDAMLLCCGVYEQRCEREKAFTVPTGKYFQRQRHWLH